MFDSTAFKSRPSIVRRSALTAPVVAALVVGVQATAQTVVNPGFDDQTGWTTANDAVLNHPGGVAPWTWDTPVVAGVIVNSTETVLPLDGTGLGLTYAGADSYTQSVFFPSDGLYTLSVSANALTGTVTLPGSNPPLLDGRFEFFVDAAASPQNVVVTTNDWMRFEWTTFVTAGAHDIGLRNTLAAVYSIAYDTFAIVPEPGTAGLLAVSLTALVRRRRRSGSAHG